MRLDPIARRMLVELMQSSLSLWERTTGQGAVHLAKESSIWKVHSGNRVPTLERYLSLSTLPSRPNRNAVVRTARFVLLQSRSRKEWSQTLEHCLQHYLQHEQALLQSEQKKS
jgi:two-component system sensor histidine kinase ChiS